MRCQRILELRRDVDRVVKMRKERAARGENVGAGGTVAPCRFVPNEVLNKCLCQEVPGYHVE